MINLKCGNCGNVWSYKGSNLYYATCPKCLYKVPLKPFNSDDKTQKNISVNVDTDDNKNITPASENKAVDNTQKSQVENLLGNNDLEIDDADEEPPKLLAENQENKDKYFCPLCNEEVEEYADCEHCGAEITWSED